MLILKWVGWLWWAVALLQTLEMWRLRFWVVSVWGISLYKYITVYALRFLCSTLFCFMGFPPWLGVFLIALNLYINRWFHGTFNGGSCMMHLSILVGLTWSGFQPIAGLYWICIQLVLSYWLAGLAKWGDPGWHDGSTLWGFLKSSPYGVPLNWPLANSNTYSPHWFYKYSARLVLYLEVLFPLFILTLPFYGVLGLAILFGMFHGLITYTFGLNRFLWSWVAAWPALLYWVWTSRL